MFFLFFGGEKNIKIKRMCMKSENRTNGKTQVAALIFIQQKGENKKTHYSIAKVSNS